MQTIGKVEISIVISSNFLLKVQNYAEESRKCVNCDQAHETFD